MQVVFHLGAECTDDDRLVRSLLRDRESHLARGVAIPAPGRYRATLLQAVDTLEGAGPDIRPPAIPVDLFADADDTARIVFSQPALLGPAWEAGTPAALHPRAGLRAAILARLFPGAEIAFLMALRNPATLVPALAAPGPGATQAAVPIAADPLGLSWLPAVTALREAVPEAQIILWCNEDAPLIWPEILRLAAGLGPDDPVPAGSDLTAALLTAEGAARLAAYLARHPPRDAAASRHVFRAFLERFAAPGALETEIGLPGWDEALVAELTRIYDNDCEIIARLAGVDMILP